MAVTVAVAVAIMLAAVLARPAIAEPVPPAVLDTPAVPSAKALMAATLAVARAGQRLVAVGERGTVLLSDDGGASWRQAPVPVQVTLTSVRFIDPRTGWAAGHGGVILRSDDGGQSWTKQLD
ncbi:MAG: glycosyl hydrolase, partial [Burkholderiales bacterium]|nr:glycosyl hydrolase [Burkholderiales bacterium]